MNQDTKYLKTRTEKKGKKKKKNGKNGSGVEKFRGNPVGVDAFRTRRGQAVKALYQETIWQKFIGY